LRPGFYEVCARSGRLWIHAWDEHRSLCRRISGIRGLRRDRLELTVERLGGRPGKLWLADQGHPAAAEVICKGVRLAFQERVRDWLARWFPDWRIRELSTEPDLENSLSPLYPRALLARGTGLLAAIASPNGARPGDVLTFGLLWLEYLRRRDPNAFPRLALFVPYGEHSCICQRARYLDPARVALELFAYTPEDCGPVDLRDWGNVEAGLPVLVSAQPPDELADALHAVPAGKVLRAPDGSLRLRVKGIELARVTSGTAWYGLHRRTPLRPREVSGLRLLAAEVARRRCARTGDPRDPLFSRAPEAWLEDQVREDPRVIDPILRSEPIYNQVPHWSGLERGVLDLLAVDHRGRLAVIELKASADPHLPFQALDYWLRVRWHQERGNFTARGYFPGILLAPDPPRLYLVSPAMEFHSSTEQILRYWDPAVEVERVGVSAAWRTRLEVVLRARGHERPDAFASLGANQENRAGVPGMSEESRMEAQQEEAAGNPAKR